MLSTVLSSPRAIAMNIEIMRTFVRVRALAATHGDLAKATGRTRRGDRGAGHGPRHLQSQHTRAQLKQVFDALRELTAPPEPPKRPIGFVHPEDKGSKTASRAEGET